MATHCYCCGSRGMAGTLTRPDAAFTPSIYERNCVMGWALVQLGGGGGAAKGESGRCAGREGH